MVSGSSSNNTSGRCKSNLANSIRIRQPPLKLGSRIVKITSAKNQVPIAFFLFLACNYRLARQCKLFAYLRNTIDQFLIRITFIIGTFGQFCIHLIKTFLHLLNMRKRQMPPPRYRTAIRKCICCGNTQWLYLWAYLPILPTVVEAPL